MRIVMMAGPPGSGKSTLAEGLVRELGPRTFLFGEELLFEIDEFSDVAVAFRTKAHPDAERMLAAYGTFLDRVRKSFDTIVFDWSCVGMIEDLPCAQFDRTTVTTHRPETRADPAVLEAHAHNVAALVERAVLIVPDVPVAMALARVLAQRGERWFDPWKDEIAELSGGGPFLDAAVRYWKYGIPRHEDVVAAHERGGWEVVTVDASRPSDDVLADALSALQGEGGRSGEPSGRTIRS